MGWDDVPADVEPKDWVPEKSRFSAWTKVEHPKHYCAHPSGIECIEITEHMSFCLGNAVKYIWRADLKEDAIEDLRKAIWYLERELSRREGTSEENDHGC